MEKNTKVLIALALVIAAIAGWATPLVFGEPEQIQFVATAFGVVIFCMAIIAGIFVFKEIRS